MTEIWKPVPGYEGSYEVSDRGRVRSLDRVVVRVDGIERRFEGLIKKPTVDRKGYPRTTLSDRNCDQRGFRIHTLVMMTFVGPQPDGYEVRHLDGNPLNNKMSNLRYGTPSENAADRKLHGRLKRGTDNHFAKIDEDDVRAIRTLSKRKIPQKEIGLLFGLTQQGVYDVVHRRAWPHVP